MDASGHRSRPWRWWRRSVTGRLVVSYVLLMLAFIVTVGWSFSALREGASDAKLARAAYVPLLITIGEVVAEQNVMNAQLNHITSAKNPTDVRQWMETARRVRPLVFRKLRDEVRTGLPAELDKRGLRAHVSAELDALERALADEGKRFEQLFQALAQGDLAKAEALRDGLIATETEGAKRMRALRYRVAFEMAALTEAAEQREARSIQLMIGMGLLTLLVGVGVSWYARRLLAPLGVVTQRARAVANGDLTHHPASAAEDEIGELARTFERMVDAMRAARAELLQAERLATIGKMAAHITHEVRNPLSSIGLNLELLEEELGGAGQQGESPQLVRAIREEVERLSQIAGQYLSAVRQPQLELETIELGELVQQCFEFVRPEFDRAQVAGRVELSDEPTVADVDRHRLRQALVNLLRNAREALGEGGDVALRVVPEGDEVVIYVEDDGPGIPDDARGTVFDPFYTTKRHGTGLGLAVTRSIVEAHRGTISCDSGLGGGTRFRIAFKRVTP